MWRWTGVQHRNILVHTYIYIQTYTYKYIYIHTYTHIQICVLCRSHIAVIFSITTCGISMSETTLAEGQRFNLIQFSNGEKNTKV
jgi:hypothetical protein